MSSSLGLVCWAFFCDARNIVLLAFMAASRASTDLSRPTNSGTTMCGKHHYVPKGQSGNVTILAEGGVSFFAKNIIQFLTIGAAGGIPLSAATVKLRGV